VKHTLPGYVLVFALMTRIVGADASLPTLPALAAEKSSAKIATIAKSASSARKNAVPGTVGQQNHPNLVGYYEFYESVKPMTDMMYKLSISPGTAGNLKVILDVDGHMTGIRANCSGTFKGDICEIRYLGDHVDPNDPSYKPPPYHKPNELLFTLSKKNGKVITHFCNLEPLQIEHKKPGVYFTKASPEVQKPEKPVPKSLQLQTQDLRPIARVLLQPKPPYSIDLKDNFTGEIDARAIVVHIPGAYLDQLDSTVSNVGLQLAATIFVKVNNTDVDTFEEAMAERYVGLETQDRAGTTDMTVYLFRTKSGRTAHIFVYFNDMYGLLGVMEMSPPKRRPNDVNL
jgi:Family of unknown function (DUF5991)